MATQNLPRSPMTIPASGSLWTALAVLLVVSPFVGGFSRLTAQEAKTSNGALPTSQEAMHPEAESIWPFPRRVDAGGTLPVGSPQFSVEPRLAPRLGGVEYGSLVRTPFESLLRKSTRFQVMPGSQVRYSVHGTLADWNIAQYDRKVGDLGSLFKHLGKPIKASPGQESLFTIDWTKGEAKLSIRCGITVQVVDEQSGTLVAGESGEVSKDASTKDIMLELGGVNWTKEGLRTQSMVEFQTKVIQVALYQAIKKMLPALDIKLAAMTPVDLAGGATLSETQPSNVSSVPHATAFSPFPAEPPLGRVKTVHRAKFCSECGGTLTAVGKFCGGCGAKIID